MDGASWVQPCRSGLANVHLSGLVGIILWRICWSGEQKGLDQFKQSSRIQRSEQNSNFSQISLISLDTASRQWRDALFLRGESTQAKQFSAVLEGQVPQSFGCRGELHDQKVVKISFGLSWNQDNLGVCWMILRLLFSVNLLYCPALLVQLTCLGLTSAIVALIDLSYRFVTCMLALLALRVSWRAAWTSLFPLDCLCFAVPYTDAVSVQMPYLTRLLLLWKAES